MTTEQTLITATSKASFSMEKASTGLQKVVADLTSAVEVHAQLLEQVAEAQQQLDGIQEAASIAERKAKAELELQVLENRKQVMLDLMNSAGLANISKEDLASLSDDLFNAVSSNENAIEDAVTKAMQSSAIKANAENSRLIADHSVAVAQKDANLVAKDREIEFLEKQVSTLEATVKAEREARVAETTARATANGVVVNTTSK